MKTTKPQTYTIRPADDLGAMPADLARTGLTLAGVDAWLDAHEDVGTFEILDETDGTPLLLANRPGGSPRCHNVKG